VTLAFDQVAVRMAAGVNLLSAEEWMAIPTLEQFDLITGSKVEFLRDGERVRTTDAVRSINAVRSAAPDRG
jgi:hypothetical protein